MYSVHKFPSNDLGMIFSINAPSLVYEGIRDTVVDLCIFFMLICSVKNAYKKHIDANVKERSQTLLASSEEICKRVLCNKHI